MTEFCESIGHPLLDWQRLTVERLLELRPDGSLRFRTALIMVGRQSGKSTLSALLILWFLYRRNARLVVGLAQSLDVARETWLRVGDTIADAEGVLEPPRTYFSNGKERHEWADGRRYLLKAANRKARGLSPDVIVADEVREWRDWDAWTALSSMTLARDDGLILAFSSAGDESSVVLNTLNDTARAQADDPSYEGDLFLAEYSAPPGADVDSPASWAFGMPALGHTVSLAAVEGLRGTLPPAEFRTEVMCQRASTRHESLMDVEAWSSCADPGGSLESSRARVTACLDVSLEGDHVTLAVAAQATDGTVRVEVAGQWSSVGAAREGLPDLLARVRPRSVGWFASSPAVALATDLRHLVGDRALEISRAPEACQSFVSLVTSRRLRHGGQTLLDEHVEGAAKLPRGDGWVFSRRGGVGAVDALYAAAGAVHLARQLPMRSSGRLIVAA